jgi:hypothetical protein
MSWLNLLFLYCWKKQTILKEFAALSFILSSYINCLLKLFCFCFCLVVHAFFIGLEKFFINYVFQNKCLYAFLNHTPTPTPTSPLHTNKIHESINLVFRRKKRFIRMPLKREMMVRGYAR